MKSKKTKGKKKETIADMKKRWRREAMLGKLKLPIALLLISIVAIALYTFINEDYRQQAISFGIFRYFGASLVSLAIFFGIFCFFYILCEAGLFFSVFWTGGIFTVYAILLTTNPDIIPNILVGPGRVLAYKTAWIYSVIVLFFNRFIPED